MKATFKRINENTTAILVGTTQVGQIEKITEAQRVTKGGRVTAGFKNVTTFYVRIERRHFASASFFAGMSGKTLAEAKREATAAIAPLVGK